MGEAYKGALEGHPRSVDIIERLGGHRDIVNDDEARDCQIRGVTGLA
jgi:hypothetical protein